MTRQLWGATAVVVTLCLASVTALAAPPKVNVQLFRPGSHSADLLSTRTAEMPEHLTWSAGGVFHYGHLPFVFEDLRGAEARRHDVVGGRLTLDVMGSIALFDWVDVGLAFPLHLYSTGDDEGFTGYGPVPTFAQGDLRLSPKLRLVHRAPGADGFGLALDALLVLPTGSADAFATDGFVAEPILVADYRVAGITFALNVGYRIRIDGPQTLFFDTVDVGNELHWAAAASYDLPMLEALTIMGEIQGASTDFTDSVTHLEGLLAGRYTLTDLGLSFLLGGGGGFIEGYGSTQFRVIGGVRYVAAGTRDRDGDGLLDDDDKCPAEAEDMDGFEDGDGCPDPDNDGDGVLDVDDKCPAEAEDKDGFEDGDGCPDPDNDGDGTLDADDKCPDELEDQDAFEDDDGCPDPDNDGDGIADVDDKCPNAAENMNDHEDDDGCPDEKLARVEKGRIIILDKVFFYTGRDKIKRRSFAVLEAVARLMNAHSDIALVEVGGHTDDVGSGRSNQRLSQKRADAVRVWLIEHGVSGDRLTAKGYGEDKPAVEGKTRKARAANRRVEFNIVDQ